MRARDLMSRPVHAVRGDATVEQATALLTQKQITAAPVLDEHGRLIGIISESNILAPRLLDSVNPPVSRGRSMGRDGDVPRTVGELMTTPVVTVIPNADIAEVAEKLLDNDVHSVPV